MKNLVIVESPTKARTLSKYLGRNYQIEATMGHIRDLPKSELGVDLTHHFEPLYIIPRERIKRVNELKKIAKSVQTVWLASDPDREGEAIAWHTRELLVNNSQPQSFQRVEFHEITETAVKEAFGNPREIDLKLVDAQQARRVLDRLVGYKLSPLLWKKVRRGLSAGRVQSVAVRLVVEREQEIGVFRPVEYWNILAQVKSQESAQDSFWVELTRLNGKKLEIPNQQTADRHLTQLKDASFSIEKISKRQTKRQSQPPFTTSTLQQTAGNKLGYSAKKIMSLAQYLYEHGLITYMRTDSLNLSPQAIVQTREYIKTNLGQEYLPAAPRVFKTKLKSAQEAHEAIRPTNMTTLAAPLHQTGFTKDHVRLYDLIWKRMLASQVKDAYFNQTSVDVAAKLADQNSQYLLHATGSVILFDGWLKVYGINHELEAINQESKAPKESLDQNQNLPELTERDRLNLLDLKSEQHFTEPPPRFNEASLIKKLEELGIGRPSTYAPTLSTIQERFYVEKQDRRFFATPLGIAVTKFLLKNFPNIVDYTFTAQMEGELDQIAEGTRQWRPTIKEFFDPFSKKLALTEEKSERVQVEAEAVDQKCPQCGKQLLVKYGKFGKFLACLGFPECKYTTSFEVTVPGKCPKDGGEILLRKTKTGRPFYGCKNYPNCTYASWSKPKPHGQLKEA